MKLLKQALAVLGTVVVVAVIVALVTPKTAHALIATAVQVVNTVSNPALISNTDGPGRIPYQSSTFCVSTGPVNGGFGCIFTYPVVPTGHRVVIQHISGSLEFFGPPAEVHIIVGSPMLGAFFPPISGDYVLFDQPVQYYFDEGVTPSVTVTVSSGGTPSASLSLIGYELTCSAATPCAPIAP